MPATLAHCALVSVASVAIDADGRRQHGLRGGGRAGQRQRRGRAQPARPRPDGAVSAGELAAQAEPGGVQLAGVGVDGRPDGVDHDAAPPPSCRRPAPRWPSRSPPLSSPAPAPVPAPTMPWAHRPRRRPPTAAARTPRAPKAASGRLAKSPPRPRSKMTAAGTIGTTSPGPPDREADAVVGQPVHHAVGGGQPVGAAAGAARRRAPAPPGCAGRAGRSPGCPGRRRGRRRRRPCRRAGPAPRWCRCSQPSPVAVAWPTRRPATSIRALVGPGARLSSGHAVAHRVEEAPGRLGVDPGAPHDVVDLDELVGLVGDPLAARAVDDGRQPRVAGEDGAVGGARARRRDGPAGRVTCSCAAAQRPHHRVVDGGVHRRPVVDDRRRRRAIAGCPRRLRASAVTASTTPAWSTPGWCGRRGRPTRVAGMTLIWSRSPARSTVGVR